MPEPRPQGQPESHLRLGQLQQLVQEHELAQYPQLQAWFTEQSAKMPEMHVTQGLPLTDGENWTATVRRGKRPWKDWLKHPRYWRNGFPQQPITVESVRSKANFFSLEGIGVQVGDRYYTQPALLEGTVPITLQTEFGPVTTQTSAFIGVIKDRQGNVLGGIGQEPLADTPNHIVVKDPLQTSAAKFMLVFGDLEKGIPGDPTKDAAFYALVKLVFPGDDAQTRQAFFEAVGKQNSLWPMATVNGNRLHSPNLAFEIVVTDEQKEALTRNGQNRWLNREERDALSRAGLLNLIGSGAFDAATRQEAQTTL